MEEKFKDVLVNKLMECRKEKGMSIYDLAQICNCRPATIYRIENNTWDPSLSLALKISTALDLNIHSIFYMKRIYE